MNPTLLLRLLLIALALLALPRATQALTLEEANLRLEEAHLLFNRGETKRATDLYVEVATSGFPTASLWANAGTAAYRAGDNGRAVLYFSRALRLDPGNSRASKGLRHVSPATNEGSEGAQVVNTIASFVRPEWWAIAAQIAFLMLCYSLARLLARAADAEARSHWLIVGAWSLFFVIVLGGMAGWTYGIRAGGDAAVVLRDGAIIRSEPRAEGTAQLEVPAGTVVDLTEAPVQGFVRCKLADGQTGYLATTDLEAI